MMMRKSAIVLLWIRLRSALAFQPSLGVIRRTPSSFPLHSSSNSLSSDDLIDKAKLFIQNKNAAGSGASTLDDVFDMCSPSVDLYGLKGDDVRPGFTSFFLSHQDLHHELMDEPSVVGLGTVQYPFIKRWRSSGDGDEYTALKDNVWKSVDSSKPRNKVERLRFDSDGKLEKVTVVEADAPLD